MHKKPLKVKARFYYERGIEHSLFLLIIFPRLKSNSSKKIKKQAKNTPFHARNGNEPLHVNFFIIINLND